MSALADPARIAQLERFTDYRVRYLPRQIEATRHKLRALENEARRYGMLDLIEGEGAA